MWLMCAVWAVTRRAGRRFARGSRHAAVAAVRQGPARELLGGGGASSLVQTQMRRQAHEPEQETSWFNQGRARDLDRSPEEKAPRIWNAGRPRHGPDQLIG